MAGSIREGKSLISIVNAVGEALYLSDEPPQILGSVLDRLIEGLNIDCAWVQMVEPGGALRLVGHRGFTPDMVAETLTLRPGQGLTGQAVATGEPVVIPDVATDPRHGLVSTVKAGLHSFAAIPITSRGGVKGVVGVASRGLAQFDGEIVELLGVLGNHIVIALDKANLYQQARAKEGALTESEVRFRTLFQEASDAIFIADATSGMIVDANKEAERLLGLPAKDIRGMSQSQLHPPDKAEYYRAIFRHHAETEHVADIEGEVIRRDDTMVPVLIGSRIVQLQGKNLVQLTMKDITELKRAERRTRVKDSAIASSISAIALADLQGNLTYVNGAFLKLWGFKHEREVLGKHALSMWQARDGAARVAETLRTTGSWAGELAGVRQDGSGFHAHASVSMVKDEAGEPICLMGAFTDITQQKLNEAKISEQSRTLNAIGELARVISSDANINQIFESFAGQMRGLLEFDRLSISLIEGDKVKFFAVSSTAKTEFNTGTVIPLESSATGWVARHKKTLIEPDLMQGTQFPLDRARLRDSRRSSIHVPLFSKGEIFGSLNLSSLRPDTFGEKEREVLEQLAAHIAGAIQIASLYSQERAHRIELEKQKEEWIDFTGIAAHELKTPLTSVIAGAELLGEEMKGKAPETEQRLIQTIMHSARSLETSLDELLELTKMKSLTSPQLSRVSIKELVDSVLEYIRPVARRKEQSLVVYLPDSLPPLNADAQRLGLVVRNLLMNAIKFTPSHGKITLRGRQESGSVVIEVQDSGIGIARERQTGLFERYYRAEVDREHFPGMGLGLALCKQIVEMHGGRIWVNSEAGKGSTFGFSLPV